MTNLRYWMVFQILLGIWLIISPLALGFREINSMTVNDVILGAVVAILGLVVSITDLPEIRHPEKKTT
jgi:multisubunit Na+/H+ antiporter MnhE subunit